MTGGGAPGGRRAGDPLHLLLLAGTGEAAELARALAPVPGLRVTASLAGVTRAPRPLEVPVRSGGFGGDEGFARYLAQQGVDAVLDATHPFAARISWRTARICDAAGVARAQLLRPGWTAGPGDRWTWLEREEAAADVIPPGARVFLATGRQTLERFANLAGRHLIVRQIDAPSDPFPFPGGEYLVGRPPFSTADEMALFRRLGIDWLVVKDAGGVASRSKLDAGRALGLPVALIRRPPQPPGLKVASVAAALDWVRGLVAPAVARRF